VGKKERKGVSNLKSVTQNIVKRVGKNERGDCIERKRYISKSGKTNSRKKNLHERRITVTAQRRRVKDGERTESTKQARKGKEIKQESLPRNNATMNEGETCPRADQERAEGREKSVYNFFPPGKKKRPAADKLLKMFCWRGGGSQEAEHREDPGLIMCPAT